SFFFFSRLVILLSIFIIIHGHFFLFGPLFGDPMGGFFGRPYGGGPGCGGRWSSSCGSRAPSPCECILG
ncbi:hypothetical protein PMAYCL1PPCAC_29883, partial [Pristionchus mayeri]